MTKTGYTPGPWEYDGDGFDSVAAQDCGTDGYIVFTRDKDGEVTEAICEIRFFNNDDESEANAKLIAAAPDMAEALRAIESGSFPNASTLAVNGDWKEAFHQLQLIARAALAKAGVE